MTTAIPVFSDTDSLEDRIKKLSEANRDLEQKYQAETEKSKQFEDRLAQVESSLVDPETDAEDVKARVQRLAQDPDGYISEVVSQALDPMKETIHSLLNEKKIERAKKWIAKREGIDPDEVEDKFGSELVRIGNERGFVKLDPEKGIRSAYDILVQERKEKESSERERSGRISGSGTESVRGTTPSAEGEILTKTQIINWIREGKYDQHRDRIKKAQDEGRVVDK